MSYGMKTVPVREVGRQSGDNWWEIDRDNWQLSSRDDSRREAVTERVCGGPLDVEVVTSRSLADDSSTVEKVRLLLACGGPTVWLEVEYPTDTVRLVRRWWGDRSDAETVDQSAFDLAERFVQTFFYLEELER